MAEYGCDRPADRRLAMIHQRILDSARAATSSTMSEHLVRKLRSFCACALITAGAAGCAQKVSQTTQMGDVVSSTPDRDRAAYIASDEALSQVQFATIEK